MSVVLAFIFIVATCIAMINSHGDKNAAAWDARRRMKKGYCTDVAIITARGIYQEFRDLYLKMYIEGMLALPPETTPVYHGMRVMAADRTKYFPFDESIGYIAGGRGYHYNDTKSVPDGFVIDGTRELAQKFYGIPNNRFYCLYTEAPSEIPDKHKKNIYEQLVYTDEEADLIRHINEVFKEATAELKIYRPYVVTPMSSTSKVDLEDGFAFIDKRFSSFPLYVLAQTNMAYERDTDYLGMFWGNGWAHIDSDEVPPEAFDLVRSRERYARGNYLMMQHPGSLPNKEQMWERYGKNWMASYGTPTPIEPLNGHKIARELIREKFKDVDRFFDPVYCEKLRRGAERRVKEIAEFQSRVDDWIVWAERERRRERARRYDEKLRQLVQP